MFRLNRQVKKLITEYKDLLKFAACLADYSKVRNAEKSAVEPPNSSLESEKKINTDSSI